MFQIEIVLVNRKRREKSVIIDRCIPVLHVFDSSRLVYGEAGRPDETKSRTRMKTTWL